MFMAKKVKDKVVDEKDLPKSEIVEIDGEQKIKTTFADGSVRVQSM